MVASLVLSAQSLNLSVLEQTFELSLEDRTVLGASWRPEDATVPCPLVIFGHGLTHDCRSPLHVPVARLLARQYGIASIALDAPGHGGRRPSTNATGDEVWLAYRTRWREDGGAGIATELSSAVERVQDLPEFGRGPVAYWGLSLGTQFGLAFLSRHDRVCAAVLGLFGAGPVVSRYAMRVRCPVLFVLQQDDQVHPRRSVEELFRQIASNDKRLISSPGAHEAVPSSVTQRAISFIVNHLRSAA